MIAIKDKMEKQRADQENQLHKKLSDLKKKRLSDLAKEHEMEIKEYERKCKEMQTDGPIGKAFPGVLDKFSMVHYFQFTL